MSLVIFVTAFGPAYCKAENIDYVSAPYQGKGKSGASPLRTIGLESGRQIYALDNEYNRQRLNQLGLLPPLEEIQEAMRHCKPDEVEVKAEPKPKRQKKAPA